jgi:hypothetical protein
MIKLYQHPTFHSILDETHILQHFLLIASDESSIESFEGNLINHTVRKETIALLITFSAFSIQYS